MKNNLLVILNIVLLVAVLVLFIDRFSGGSDKNKPTGSAENTSTVQTTAGDIVYVNVDSLLNGYDLYNELRTQLLKKQQQSESNLTSRSKQLERKMLEYQNKAQKGLMLRTEMEQTEKSLMQEQQSLIQLKDQLSMSLMEDEQAMNKQIYDSIQSVLKSYNKDYTKHVLILNNTMGSTILHSDPGRNITDTIMSLINLNYNSKNDEASK